MRNYRKIRLQEINIYPIKSMGKISLKESNALIRGFKYDRRMMLTDGNGEFMSQRRIPEMARFRLSADSEGFIVKHDKERIHIPYELNARKLRKVTVWDDQLTVPETDPFISEWFSDQLNEECHLVFMDSEGKRTIHQKYAINNEEVSFADGFPYLIISTGSLLDLNQKLRIPVPMDRFRPNMVISTEVPFTEDGLDVFTLGEAKFKRVKPCSRCVITTTDQSTGIRSKEPLRTLSKYRKIDQDVFFGQNLICLREGRVKTGDILTTTSNSYS